MPRVKPGPCARCGEPSGLQSWCTPCKAAYARTHYERRAATGPYWRESYLRVKYGITLDEFNQLFADREGKCDICGGAGTYSAIDRTLVVDHDHESGEIRGLLCDPCNIALGKMKDDPQRLRQAASYVERAASGGGVT